MKTPPSFRSWPVLPLLVCTASLEAGLATGGTAYTKRVETKLLAEPAPLAAVVGRLGFGRAVKIAETRGTWLRIADGGTAGWVFAGNVSETKPAEGKGLDGLGLQASQTTATAAARPLAPAAEDYAARRHLANARDDLNWLIAQCHGLTAEQVEAFLQEQKKGEYQ